MARLSKRLVALVLIGAFVAVAAVPASPPARGAAPTALAVATFENFVGAPYSAVEKMSDALYKAVAASNNYAAKGGGPLQIKPALTGDPLVAAVGEAAKFGADHVLIGNVIDYGGGRVVYSLAVYTVDPVKLIRTRAFAQTYPASETAMASAFSTDVASLEAPRTPTGTVTGVVGNNIRADLGQVEGFSVGQRFNVVRSGAVIGQAVIDQIEPAYATLEITNVSPNTAPVIGDKLVSLETQAASGPVPVTEPNSWNPLAIIVGVAAVLLAVGHHGQPVSFVAPSPSPTTSTFTVAGTVTGGTSANPVITFTFSQAVSAADQTAIVSTMTKASFTTQIPPAGASPPQPLGSLGSVVFDSTGTVLTVTVSSITLSPGEILAISLFSTITSASGVALTPPPPFTTTGSVARKPLNVTKPAPRSGSHPPGASKAPAAPPRPAKPDRGGSGRQK